MTKIGIPRLQTEKALNHPTGDIAEVYDRHDYLPEERTALERWSDDLADVGAGRDSKVVALSRRARLWRRKPHARVERQIMSRGHCGTTLGSTVRLDCQDCSCRATLSHA